MNQITSPIYPSDTTLYVQTLTFLETHPSDAQEISEFVCTYLQKIGFTEKVDPKKLIEETLPLLNDMINCKEPQ